MSIRLPNFLIVGAMKAGTTTLHRDLSAHPSVFLPEHKEPNSLASDSIFELREREAYARLFRNAGQDQVCGEASTTYTMLPDHAGVPERARKVLGADLKVIYMVRDPVRRIISHHYHNYGHRRAGPDVNAAVRDNPQYLNYSRYAYQITPWIDALGRASVGIWKFEDYIVDRSSIAREIFRFLGLPDLPVTLDQDLALNVSADKSIATRLWRKLILERRLYTHYVKPRIPRDVRAKLARILLPAAPPKPISLNAETEAFIRHELKNDIAILRGIVGDSTDIW